VWRVLLACLVACGRIGFDGQPATGDAARATDATDAAPTLTWSHLAAYADQTCALRGGTAYCWGQIGDAGMNLTAIVPHAYSSTAVVDIAPGDTFMCEVHDGMLGCWGTPPYGLATYGGTGTPVTAVSAGRGFACLVETDGVYCWGANGSGQLGLGDTADRPGPARLALAASYTQIRAGDDHACAFDGTTPVCWGHNDDGTMGNGSMNPASQLTPQPVSAGVAGLPLIPGWHGCALSGGAVWCWGRDDEGELGDGGSTSTGAPEQILSPATLLATGGGPADYDATCEVMAHPQCWGVGTHG